jgi:kynurenine 3-monooxygenase
MRFVQRRLRRRCDERRVTMVGAGLGGALAAVFLARRGLDVTFTSSAPTCGACRSPPGGRSTWRWPTAASRRCASPGSSTEVRQLLTTMRGRMIHPVEGPLDLQPYGQRAHEVIYSVSRPG